MFYNRPEEVNDGDTSGGQKWGASPADRSPRNESTSYCPASTSSTSSNQSLNEGATNSASLASGDVLDSSYANSCKFKMLFCF